MTPAKLRSWHANISAFIAPMVLFYALTGVLQIFSLHESHGPYTAPAFLQTIAQVHKNQTTALHAAPGPGGPGGPAGGPPKAERHLQPIKVYALKWLFALEGLGLAATTVFGIWIGLVQLKRRRTMLALLAAGTVLPLLLVLV